MCSNQLLRQQLFWNIKLSPKPWYCCLEKYYKGLTQSALVPLWPNIFPTTILKHQILPKPLYYCLDKNCNGWTQWLLVILWPTLKPTIVLNHQNFTKTLIWLPWIQAINWWCNDTTDTLDRVFHKPFVEANPYIRFGYDPQTIFNHTGGQVPGQTNADPFNAKFTSQQSTKIG